MTLVYVRRMLLPGQQLELNEKRLLLLAMSHIKSTDTELLEHKIPITSLEQFLLGVGIDWQQVIKGLVLLLAVFFDVYNRRRAG